MTLLNNSITDVSGILVGQVQDEAALTGCTVIICKEGAIGGVDQRGGAPGTRETDALRPMHQVQKLHAVMLAGGSAFGLDAASGAMRYLEENKVGFNTGVAKVPIVASAILFDLGIGKADIRPTAAMGYQACKNATAEKPIEGNAGAGTGATVGKILGMGQAMKSGIGTASIDLGGGIIVGAIIAVNALGDVIDPETGQILAGVRPLQKGPVNIGGKDRFADTLKIMKSFVGKSALRLATMQNTVIGVVATNADLTKEEANKVAQMAQNGLAKAIRPANTMLDGDTLFCMATCNKKCDVSIVGAFAAEVVAKAIISAVHNAKSAGGLPAFQDE
jgi:L-aminopeptidase/D-esterase-like protein